jgi:2'-5' RNA ligase
MPATIQRQIVRWRAEHFPPEAGRPVAAANLHLTLAFLGDVSAEKQRPWRQWPDGFLSRVYAAPRRCRTVAAFARGLAGYAPAATWILQLANMLRAQAARSGCYQSPQPFHPHITLLRDAGQAVAIPPPGFTGPFR